MKRFLTKFKHSRTALIICAANAIFIIALCYINDNLSVSLSAGPSIGQKFEVTKALLLSEDEPEAINNLLILNVAYDRELVNINYDHGGLKGKIDIADREKLLNIITKLKESDNYKYIILDIAFPKGLHTTTDSALFHTIASMDRIAIPKVSGTELADDILKSKARYSEYTTIITETNFVKYDYMINGEPTLPLSVYMDMGGAPIIKKGPLYFTDGHLCKKAVALKYPVKMWNEYDSNGRKLYYNIEGDIYNDSLDIQEMAKDKIVIIGDITEHDQHTTYIGPIAGAIINYDALYALIKGEHIISPLYLFSLFIVYTLMSLLLVQRKPLIKYIPWLNKYKLSKLIRLIVSFISINIVLSILAFIIYKFVNIEFDVFIPSIFFTIFNYAIDLYHIHTTTKKVVASDNDTYSNRNDN